MTFEHFSKQLFINLLVDNKVSVTTYNFVSRMVSMGPMFVWDVAQHILVVGY